MIAAETLALFIPVGLALNLTPGADMLLCLGIGARSGPRAGLAAAAGISTGGMVHAGAAGLGLAALIATHPALFEAIRWAGVAYLVWLAAQMLRAPAPKPAAGPSAAPAPAAMSAAAAFRRGVAVNLLNPKIALFTLALIPQFVRPEAGSTLSQFLIFGLILSVGGMVVNGAAGLGAGHAGRGVARRAGLARALRRISALMFLGLAARLAFERR